MNRITDLFKKTDNGEQQYEPLESDASFVDEDVRRPVLVVPDLEESAGEPFSWFEYLVFMMLGVAMLWAWCVQLFQYTDNVVIMLINL